MGVVRGVVNVCASDLKGNRTVKRYKFCLAMMLVALSVLPCVANEAIQAAAKTVSENLTGKNLAKLYKVRGRGSTPVRSEMALKACVAGLCAVGDEKNAKKLNDELAGRAYISSFMDVCPSCNGEGALQGACYKCKGTGSCQNRKCNGGSVVSSGLDGRSSVRKCSVCGGTGQCISCNGIGKTEKKCSQCQGVKKVVNKGSALTACKELLNALIVAGKEIDTCVTTKSEPLPERQNGVVAKHSGFGETARRRSSSGFGSPGFGSPEDVKRRREKYERLEREKLEYENRLKAEREERERNLAEEKQRREIEEAERVARIQKELDEKKSLLSSLPKTTEGWTRGVAGSGDESEFVQCTTFSNGRLNPVRVRVFSNGKRYVFIQPRNVGPEVGIIVDNLWSATDSDLRLCDEFYLAIYLAAKKALEWRRTAKEHHEVEFGKEIPLQNSFGGISFDIKDNHLCEGSAKRSNVHFWFYVCGQASMLSMELLDRKIAIDLEDIDMFLKTANPLGAYEVLQRYNELYK